MLFGTQVAPTFLKEMLNCGRNGGMDIPAILHGLGIDPAALTPIMGEDYARIWLALTIQMDDEFLGMGQSDMPSGSFTLIGHAVRQAPNLHIGLNRALRFFNMVLKKPYGTVTLCDRHASVLLDDNHIRPAFAYRVYFAMLHSLNCWMVGERIPLQAVALPCPRPTETRDYDYFMGVPVTFGADQARLSFQKRFLHKPVNKSESELKSYLRAAPRVFLDGYRHDDGGLKSRIVAELSTTDAHDWGSIDDIAARLGMSVSTLNRHLKHEGQSFGEIKEERRRNLAISLLKNSQLPISDIAIKVGYAEPSAFYRAFKKWFGVGPNNFRV